MKRTPTDNDSRVAEALGERHDHANTNFCVDHGHRYRHQCWASQGLGCRNTCGWGARY